MNSFYPDKIVQDTAYSPVVITDIKVHNVSVRTYPLSIRKGIAANRSIDFIDKIETFKDGALIHTKALTWRLSRLVKNYGVTIVESNDSNKIYFLSNYDDNDFAFAFEELKKENTK